MDVDDASFFGRGRWLVPSGGRSRGEDPSRGGAPRFALAPRGRGTGATLPAWWLGVELLGLLLAEVDAATAATATAAVNRRQPVSVALSALVVARRCIREMRPNYMAFPRNISVPLASRCCAASV